MLYIGTFDSPEQASAAYMSVKKDLANTNPSALCADEVDAVFHAAKKKAQEEVGVSRRKNGISRGVKKLRSGKFGSRSHWGGKEPNDAHPEHAG